MHRRCYQYSTVLLCHEIAFGGGGLRCGGLVELVRLSELSTDEIWSLVHVVVALHVELCGVLIIVDERCKGWLTAGGQVEVECIAQQQRRLCIGAIHEKITEEINGVQIRRCSVGKVVRI